MVSALLSAIFEVLALLIYMATILYHVFTIVSDRRPGKGYYAWSSVADLFQEQLPMLATFSAMKTLRYVHPSLVLEQFLDAIQENDWFGGVCHKVFSVLWFLAGRMCLMAFGVSAFAVKSAAVGLRITHPQRQFWDVGTIFFLLAFLNQVMGIVVLEVVLQHRLFLFIFGGQDAEFQEEERAMKRAYMARLMSAIWEDYSSRGMPFQALVMLGTIDHLDLQKLVLKENSRLKGEMMSVSAIERSACEDADSEPHDGTVLREQASEPSDNRGASRTSTSQRRQPLVSQLPTEARVGEGPGLDIALDY